ncbi:hypothetical protein K438DRAFT_1756229 [Mycena galopus ATCC 62051]|nr:hypothetical protein K438DRAFT_1756229 [Mycena galopus ATCC 62051]
MYRLEKSFKSKAKAPPVRVVAESDDSESDEVASEDKSDAGESEQYAEDIAPNEAEFRAEIPCVLSKKSKTPEVNSDDETKDVKGKGLAVEDLFSESDHESIKIDKPRRKNLQSTVEPDSDDTLSDAPPRVINDNSDVDMPAVRTSGHRTGSRHSSLSSWSSGHDLCVSDSDGTMPTYNSMRLSLRASRLFPLTDPLTATAPPRPPAPPTAMLMILTTNVGLLRKNFRRPVEAGGDGEAQVRLVPAAHGGMVAQLDRIAAATVDAVSRPESDWHISARLMFPAPGKDIGLTRQTDELRAVLHGCIGFIKLSLLFDDAYPAIRSRTGFARTYLLMAAQHTAAIHIKDRLTRDLTFAARLADIPLDRINISRGNIRQVAAQEVAGLFGFALSLPEEVKTSAYEDVYRNHMCTLSNTRAFSPKALHVVLHRLYNLLTESTMATSNATDSSALRINLVEIPDSD